MPLSWDIKATQAHQENVFTQYTESMIWNALILMTPLAQPEDLPKYLMRLRIAERIGISARVTPIPTEVVKAFVGLKTNSTHMTDRQWKEYCWKILVREVEQEIKNART